MVVQIESLTAAGIVAAEAEVKLFCRLLPQRGGEATATAPIRWMKSHTGKMQLLWALGMKPRSRTTATSCGAAVAAPPNNNNVACTRLRKRSTTVTLSSGSVNGISSSESEQSRASCGSCAAAERSGCRPETSRGRCHQTSRGSPLSDRPTTRLPPQLLDELKHHAQNSIPADRRIGVRGQSSAYFTAQDQATAIVGVGDSQGCANFSQTSIIRHAEKRGFMFTTAAAAVHSRNDSHPSSSLDLAGTSSCGKPSRFRVKSVTFGPPQSCTTAVKGTARRYPQSSSNDIDATFHSIPGRETVSWPITSACRGIARWPRNVRLRRWPPEMAVPAATHSGGLSRKGHWTKSPVAPKPTERQEAIFDINNIGRSELIN